MRQAGVEHSGYERQVRDGKGDLRECGQRSREVERIAEKSERPLSSLSDWSLADPAIQYLVVRQ